MRRGRILLLTLVAAALGGMPATASAALIFPSQPLTSATSGIALGADGNLWAAEQFANSIKRVSPSGAAVLPGFPLDGEPRSVVAGPDGTVWVTIPGQRQIVWFDATAASPTAHVISTGGANVCGPSAIVDGGNGRMYFSTETTASGCVTNPGRIGSVNAITKLVDAASTPGAGQVYDLVVANGKLFAPDYSGDAVRRYSLTTPVVQDATIGVTGGPDGITATNDGMIWITLLNTGQVARFPITQNGGNVQAPAPRSGFSGPFGITPTPYGGVFVAYRSSGKLARYDANGEFGEEILLGLGNVEPFDLVSVPTGAWFTDQNSGRIVRVLDSLPTATTGGVTASSSTTVSLAGTFDTVGNDTQASFEYGTTTAYGSSSTVTALPASSGGPVPGTATLTGLAPGTTYHARAKATSSRGTGVGADITFTTAAAAAATPAPGPVVTPTPTPSPTPKVAATVSVKSTAKGSSTTITSLSVKGLLGGETIKVACTAKKKGLCPFKSKTQTKVKKGTRSLSTLFGKKRPVKVGAVVTITVSADGKRPAVLTLTIRKGKAPKQAKS